MPPKKSKSQGAASRGGSQSRSRSTQRTQQQQPFTRRARARRRAIESIYLLILAAFLHFTIAGLWITQERVFYDDYATRVNLSEATPATLLDHFQWRARLSMYFSYFATYLIMHLILCGRFFFAELTSITSITEVDHLFFHPIYLLLTVLVDQIFQRFFVEFFIGDLMDLAGKKLYDGGEDGTFRYYPEGKPADARTA